MLKTHLIPVALFFSVLSLYSCLDEFDNGDSFQPIEEEGYQDVDSRLWSYYDAFQEEGKRRGLNINLKSARISGEIDEINDGNVIGTCQYGGFSTNHVTIDNAFWSSSSNLGREFVVFHELGHCFLNRGHKEDSTSEGLCVSLMRSGTGRCRDAYNTRNREYYLDELFSQTGN